MTTAQNGAKLTPYLYGRRLPLVALETRDDKHVSGLLLTTQGSNTIGKGDSGNYLIVHPSFGVCFAANDQTMAKVANRCEMMIPLMSKVPPNLTKKTLSSITLQIIRTGVPW
jgi:hypothetical protein